MFTLPTWSPCVLLDALATESRFLEALEGDFVGIASRVVDTHQTVRGADALAPSAVGLSQRVISCASLSKCPGAPGLRLGWRSRATRRSGTTGRGQVQHRDLMLPWTRLGCCTSSTVVILAL